MSPPFQYTGHTLTEFKGLPSLREILQSILFPEIDCPLTVVCQLFALQSKKEGTSYFRGSMLGSFKMHRRDICSGYPQKVWDLLPVLIHRSSLSFLHCGIGSPINLALLTRPHQVARPMAFPASRKSCCSEKQRRKSPTASGLKALVS